MIDDKTLVARIEDARRSSIELLADLSDEQLRVEKIDIVNPLDWEVGHVAYFQELFCLRQVDGRASLREDADALFDSILIEHGVRWDLPLPDRATLMRYCEEVRDATIAFIRAGLPDEAARYRQHLAVYHEDMHNEAFTYTRQTMAFPPPQLSQAQSRADADVGAWPGDAQIDGGRYMLGAPQDTPWFVLDNEQWACEVDVAPFAIAKAPVTQQEIAAFIDDGGYARRELWSDEGWVWREALATDKPMHWRKRDGVWQRRHFDRWVDLEPHHPVIHFSWHEANAYCRWAKRRLPTEAEWELAASGFKKRRFPWGGEAPLGEHVNMDWRGMGCVDVAAKPAGDSWCGCRQMLGNVWEWCSDTFDGYPGFEPGPYKEYSEPLFGETKVLRGGCWATRSRLIRNTWRNYYEPQRRDVWAGFRTCAL